MSEPRPSARSLGLIRFGVFEFDPATGDLWKSGRHLRLSDQPRQVLCMLVARPGELVSRDELRRALWPDDTFVDFDTGLNVVVNRIRQTLDDSASAPRFIETFARRGYRFIAPIAAPAAPTVHIAGDPTSMHTADTVPDAMDRALRPVERERPTSKHRVFTASSYWPSVRSCRMLPRGALLRGLPTVAGWRHPNRAWVTSRPAVSTCSQPTATRAP